MVSFALWSTASLLTPGSARNTAAIACARVLVGVAQGFLIPSVHTVLSQVGHQPSIVQSTDVRVCWLGSGGRCTLCAHCAASAWLLDRDIY